MTLTNFIMNILEGKLNINIPNFIYWGIVIIALFCALKWVYAKYVKPFNELVCDIKNKLEKTDEIDCIKETQKRAIENSIKSDEDLHREIEKLSEKIGVIGDMIVEKQKKDDETEMIKHQNDLMKDYRYYKKIGHWTKNESDCFWNLYRDYRSRGGNSFIEHDVKPVMMNLEIIDE